MRPSTGGAAAAANGLYYLPMLSRHLVIGLVFAAAGCATVGDEPASVASTAPTTQPAVHPTTLSSHPDVANRLDSPVAFPAELNKLKVPNKEEAEKLALQYWFRARGLLAEEGIRARGLYRLGREIQGFGKRGDWIWELRVEYTGFAVDGWILVNANTGEVLSLPVANEHGR